MKTQPKFIRDAQRGVDRKVLAHIRKYGLPTYGGVMGVAWLNSLERLMASGKVTIRRTGRGYSARSHYIAKKGARA